MENNNNKKILNFSKAWSEADLDIMQVSLMLRSCAKLVIKHCWEADGIISQY
jgi:hypothetical protein